MYQFGYVAYYEMNLEYVIDKYCINKERPKLNCDGKCYLMQKLSAADDNSNDDEKRAPRLTEIVFPLFCQAIAYNCSIQLKSTKNAMDTQVAKLYLPPFQSISLPPPKV